MAKAEAVRGGGSQYATGNITKGPFNPAGWSDEYTKATADQIYNNDAIRERTVPQADGIQQAQL